MNYPVIDIPRCPYCNGLIFFDEASAVQPSGELWHQRCAITFNRPSQPKCRHPDQPGQEHLGLPCAWPDCPEGHDHVAFYLPIPDPQRGVFVEDSLPPLSPQQATYKRVTAYVSPIAQSLYDMPPLLYRWVLQ